MTESTIAQFIYLVTIAVLVTLIYVINRGQASALTALCDIRRALDQILAGNKSIEETLTEHRHVLNDAHRRIYAVTKGLGKPTP